MTPEVILGPCFISRNDTLKPGGGKLKNAARVPSLRLRREWSLRHSPTVVAGSSAGCDCTGNKGQCLVYGVQQAADPGIATSPRSPEGPGASFKLQDVHGHVLEEDLYP